VAPWVLRAGRPLLTYNHNRDAYILRGIGKRMGPVLRSRDERREPSGRFRRESEPDKQLIER
jgi:hypothetical protein